MRSKAENRLICMENMNEKGIKEAGIYYFIGNLFNTGMSFLTVPIFTRILSTSDYGIVTTYNSWIVIVSMVIGCAMHMGIRSAFNDYKENIDDFMSVVTTFNLGYGGLISFFISLGLIMIRKNLFTILLIICMIHGMASALIQNYSMYLMMQFRYKKRTLIMILPNLLSVFLSIFVVLFILEEELYLGRIIPTALITTFFGIWTVILVYQKSHILYRKEYLKYALSISTPLVLHGVALNLLSQSDRTMITWLADSSQTGIYSLIYNFSMIATVITTSLDGVWVPWFTEQLKKRELPRINTFSKDYINLMTYAMAGVILIGPEVVRLLASEKYWEGIPIIPPIVLANYMIFVYTLYVNIEHFHKKTLYITINTIISAVVNMGLNYIFIPKYGYVAAAYTTLIAYFGAFILHSRYAKKLEPELYPLNAFFIPLLHICLIVLLFYVFMGTWAIRWAIMIAYLAMMFHINRKRIYDLFSNCNLERE